MTRENSPMGQLFDNAESHSAEHYRLGYLKMKSVLHDRATELPAYPLLFDNLRTWLDDRRQLGVLHFDIVNIEMVESIYGWQVFDSVVSHAAQALRSTRPPGRRASRTTPPGMAPSSSRPRAWPAAGSKATCC